MNILSQSLWSKIRLYFSKFSSTEPLVLKRCNASPQFAKPFFLLKRYVTGWVCNFLWALVVLGLWFENWPSEHDVCVGKIEGPYLPAVIFVQANGTMYTSRADSYRKSIKCIVIIIISFNNTGGFPLGWIILRYSKTFSHPCNIW